METPLARVGYSSCCDPLRRLRSRQRHGWTSHPHVVGLPAGSRPYNPGMRVRAHNGFLDVQPIRGHPRP